MIMIGIGGSMIELNDGTLSVKIKERGAELSSVVLGGREYIWQGDEKIWSGQCPVLFPICGKLRDGTYRYGGRTYSMELHGFAREKIFSVKQVSPQEAVFTICDDEQTRAQYPFSFVFSVTYTLQGGELKITYSVYNRGNEPMWFNFGSHESYRTEGQEGVWTLEWSEWEDLVLRDLSPNGISDSHTLLRENTKEVCIEQSLFVQDSLVFDGLRSREVTDAAGMSVRTAILCCQAYHARRASLYYQACFPEAKILVSPVVTKGISRENWYRSEEGIRLVLTEVEHCGSQFGEVVRNAAEKKAHRTPSK